VRLRDDVEELHLQDVAWPSALDEDRPRQGMDGSGLHARHVRLARARAELAVDAVAGGQDHFLPLVDRDDGWDGRMKSIVSRRGLILQPLAPVDLDALHCPLLSARLRMGGYSTAA